MDNVDLRPKDRTGRTKVRDGSKIDESFAPDAYDDEEDIDIGLGLGLDNEDPFYDQK